MSNKYQAASLDDDTETQVRKTLQNARILREQTPEPHEDTATATLQQIAEKQNEIIRHLRGY